MKQFFNLIPALLLIFYLASFSGCGVNPPCNNCGIDTIPHDTVPTDTVPQDTVPLPKYYGTWDWIPYPPCIDAKITLTVDSFSNVNVSTYPHQCLYYGYNTSCLPFTSYYFFCDGEQYIVIGDTIYFPDFTEDIGYVGIYAISSTKYVCDTIDLKYLLPTLCRPGDVLDYTFIRRDN